MKMNAEKKKIKQLLDEVPENKKVVAERLLKEIFFMIDRLDDCKKDVEENGTIVFYQNGANQSGTRENPAIKLYTSLVLKFDKLYKDFMELLPDNFNFSNDLIDFIDEV